LNYENYLIIIILYSNLTHVHLFVAVSNVEILGQVNKHLPAYKYDWGFLTYTYNPSNLENVACSWY
jgi:hypothetical protein